MTSDNAAPVQVALLGNVRAWRSECELDLGPAQRRGVLAVLALAAGKPVSRDELIDAVWDAPPGKVDSTLHCHISRLRGVLEPGHGRRAPGTVLARSGPSYVLRAEPGNVDAIAFISQVTAARRARDGGDLAIAARLLEYALGLWQGEALAGMGGQWAQAQRTRLEDARLAALEEHAQVKLALGRHAEMTAELVGLTSKYPLREGLRGLLMIALYRSGRQAEALAVYHDTRRMLGDELGIEPCPELQRLHEQVLMADPALAPTSSPAGRAGGCSAVGTSRRCRRVRRPGRRTG